MGILASNLKDRDQSKQSRQRSWEDSETEGRVEGNTDTITTIVSETGGLVSTPLDAFEGQFRRQER